MWIFKIFLACILFGFVATLVEVVISRFYAVTPHDESQVIDAEFKVVTKDEDVFRRGKV